MITIQMQIMFIENFITHLSVVDKYRNVMEVKTVHITQEIFEFEAKNKDDTERLRRIIAIDIILNTGDLDNPISDKVSATLLTTSSYFIILLISLSKRR
jgi:3-methyladenine DNA glycosylase AlkD